MRLVKNKYRELRIRDVLKSPDRSLRAFTGGKHRISVKRDGWWAKWDPSRRELRSKGGMLIRAPEHFTKCMPPYPVIGELYVPGHDFSIVGRLRAHPEDPDWLKARYSIFDGAPPAAPNAFGERIAAVSAGLLRSACPHISAEPQVSAREVANLFRFLKAAIDRGEEGVVITANNGKRVKIKRRQDAEAVVVGRRVDAQGASRSLHVHLLNRSGNVFRNKSGAPIDFHLGIGFRSGEMNRIRNQDIVKFSYETMLASGRPKTARFVGMRNRANMRP